MTREETKEAIKVMQNYVDGGLIESVKKGGKIFVFSPNPCWDFNSFDYREIPVKRYWDCQDDVPFGLAVYRRKGEKEIMLPRMFTDKYFIIGYPEKYPWCTINNFEYSTDGKTWQECLK